MLVTVTGKFQNWANIPLNAAGHAQGVDAEAFAEWPWRAAPQGEGFGDVQARARAFVDSVAVEQSDAHVAIVSHGVLVMALLCEFLGWNAREAWAERRGFHINTALSMLRLESGKWSLKTLACARHIDVRK